MAPQDLHALVDMGSNGIRFSITDLSPARARTLPQIHHHRAPISLHDAQFTAGSAERQPLSETTIASVVASFRSFQRVCNAHGVPRANIRVLATEATRTAPNSSEFVEAIRSRVGWQDINMLPKEEEARLGAFGIAASVPSCRGLVLDLGGGSVQLSWIRTRSDGEVPNISDAVVSLPYGAAAIMKRLEGADKHATKATEDEVTDAMVKTLQNLDIPADIRDEDGNVSMYLSGGGFRGWGYLLMASHPDGNYPIQMISGYDVTYKEFTDDKRVDHHVKKRADVVANAISKKDKKNKKEEESTDDTGIHRISARRLSQLPAIKLVVSALETALKQAEVKIGRVTFCAGGVPAGMLFMLLEAKQRAQNALTQAASLSSEVALKTQSLSHDHVSALFSNALHGAAPSVIKSVAPALTVLLNTHSALPKDIRAAAALRYPITGSVPISSALGIDHGQRSALGLALCARWGGESELPELDAREFARLRSTLGARESWWAELLGRLAALVADVAVHSGARVASIRSKISSDAQARDVLSLALTVDGGDKIVLKELAPDDEPVPSDPAMGSQSPAEEMVTGSGLGKAVKTLEKVGKKKRWVTVRGADGSPQAYGLRVEAEVEVPG